MSLRCLVTIGHHKTSLIHDGSKYVSCRSLRNHQQNLYLVGAHVEIEFTEPDSLVSSRLRTSVSIH